jgi:hypothetical protein
MRRIIDTAFFSPPDLHLISCCRLYLDVVTLSNLLMACGGQMDTLAYQHERPASSSSDYHRSVQQRPNNRVAWDRTMSIWFHDDDQLRTPLGPWLCTGDRLRRTWRASPCVSPATSGALLIDSWRFASNLLFYPRADS